MFDPKRVIGFLGLTSALWLGACAAPPRPAEPAAPSPLGTTRPPAVATYEVLESEVTVLVFRDGPMAQLGHNHVVATTGLRGRVELREPLTASSLWLELPLALLDVDDPARRRQAGEGFPDDLVEADRAGTRRNMLGPALLDAARFPVIRLQSVAIEGAGTQLLVRASAEIAGGIREITVPVLLELDETRLVARGEFSLTHAELGLAPYSAALGALRVREDLRVSYRIVAGRGAT